MKPESMPDLLVRAADALLSPAEAPSPVVQDLLDRLGYAERDDRAPGRAALLRAGARLRRLFRVAAPDAPGLIFMGGEADPAAIGAGTDYPVASLAGSALSLGAALERCVGEGIEYLSQIGHMHPAMRTAPAPATLAPLDPASLAFIEAASGGLPIATRVTATRLSDGAPTAFPADLCLRRPASERDFTPALKLSTGCGAGPSVAAAGLHGLLELLERDAASLWWRGGVRGRLLPLDGEASRNATGLLARLRAGAQRRRTWLLDITSDLAVPCVAAVSVGGEARGFAYGLGCRLTLADAAEAAIFELCQMELGQALAEVKRSQRGETALNDGDRGHLRRATLIDAEQCALLHPTAPAPVAREEPADTPAAALQGLVLRLAEVGIQTYMVELTRPELAIPVVRILAPGLQLDPCDVVTERLATTIRRTGGGEAHHGGIALF